MPVREPLSRCGALVIDSMPPATTTFAEPALIASWASITAFIPDPQTLLMVVQPADTGMPAPSEACRAGAWPRPAGSTQPMITSSTWSGARPACSSAPVIALLPRIGVGTPVNWPRKEPIAVRLAPTMTTSDMLTPGVGRPRRMNGLSRESAAPCRMRPRRHTKGDAIPTGYPADVQAQSSSRMGGPFRPLLLDPAGAGRLRWRGRGQCPADAASADDPDHAGPGIHPDG